MKKVHISAVTAAILALLTLSSEVSATDIASPAYVKSGDAGIPPAVYLMYGNTPYWDMAGGPNNYRLYDHINDNPVFIVNTSTSDANSLVVGPSGGVSLANNAVYIDRAQKRMGIGTDAPEDTLHIKNPNFGNLILEKDGQSKWKLGTTGTGGIALMDMLNSNTIPFWLEGNAPADSLHIRSNGNVGIGTDTPSTTLDVNGLIQASLNGPGTESVYELLTLSANDTDGDGPSEAAFVLLNKKAGEKWLFRTIDDGKAFTATLGGTGGPEFKIVSDEGDYTKTKLYIGGKLVFANGKIQSSVLP